MKLVWTQRALEDRRAIFDYIETEDSLAAVTADDRIAAATLYLIDFPHIGRPGRVEGTHELVFARTPYIVPYWLEGDVVRILRVVHAARIWPDEFQDTTESELITPASGSRHPAPRSCKPPPRSDS